MQHCTPALKRHAELVLVAGSRAVRLMHDAA
jgi:hypothetical protein